VVTHADGPRALPVTGVLVDGGPSDALAAGADGLPGEARGAAGLLAAEEQAATARASKAPPVAIPRRGRSRRRRPGAPGPPSRAVNGTSNRVCRESPRRAMSSFSSC
jgi:hypothetical protein